MKKLIALTTLASAAWAQQFINGSRVIQGTVNYCADTGSTDAYACNISPVLLAYSTGACYQFKANTANTGAATVNLGPGVKTIKKASGGVTTDLADNDIRAGQIVTICYDGANMQMQSTLGNTAAGLADPGSNGMLARTNSGSVSSRTVTGTSNEITVSNGDGVSGNPTLSLSSTFDISGKTSTKSVKTGTSAPGACAIGELFYDTNATPGQNLYGCTATNTWTLLGDGGGGGGGGVTTAIDYTKKWYLYQALRNVSDVMILSSPLGSTATDWNPFSGSLAFGTRATDSAFQYYAEMAPANGGTMTGTAGGGGFPVEYYRQANTKLHVRFKPVTSTNARYWVGFSDCTFAAQAAADSPSCNQVAFLASTTTANHNWYLVTGAGSTPTLTDTGVAWSAGTVYELDLTLGSSVSWAIGAATGTVSSTLPATGAGMRGGLIQVTATTGSATTTARWDRLYLQMDN